VPGPLQLRAGRRHHELPGVGEEHRTGGDALVAIGDQVDGHLTPQAMGPGYAPDLDQPG
jgi:hypothetical protein